MTNFKNLLYREFIISFKNGEIVDKHMGTASKTQLEEKLNSLI